MLVVTGAAGFIGSHLVELLAARGERVVGVDRRPGIPPVATRLVADLVEAPPGAVDDALREADAVFHLAALPGVRDRGGGADLDARRHHDNVLAAERVLTRVPPGVPLVVTSSSSVYGSAWHAGRRPSRESDPLHPLGAYARSKVEMERRCHARLAAGGHVTIARPFTVAGERQRPDMAIARWLAAAHRGQPLPVLGSPDRRRDITDVHDVCAGLLAAADRAVPGPLNLGTGTGHRLADVIATIATVLGVTPRITLHPAGPEEATATLADPTRCHFTLGFRPHTDLPTLIHRQATAAGLITPAA